MESENVLKDVETFIKTKMSMFKTRSYVYEGIIKVNEYTHKDLKLEFYYCDEKLRHIVIKSSDLNSILNSDSNTQNINDILRYLEEKLKG
ncbi:MAG: hypothetical protein QXY87_13765 [Saccharolobus sp.]|uniref:Uncharacterized protein n=1 Tax=Saccharolobus shibatae (strain ATCC 51178 / DSM 5389 / JCM 8931 / NBRC 15437 / B12) TaxID=523848 RepID=A0A8F5GTK2_SACSH|nr:hypothetical protein [Saccharolobus shibatae]MCH4816670.1 hypothetical protein [Saccharolobus shibatae]QXJ28457.1 hypothetical protein J5U23_01326 [Saccharolobus shibatae B12]